MITPPDAQSVNTWVTFLTPIALAILVVVNTVAARLSVTRGNDAKVAATVAADKVATVADEVKATLAETNKKTASKLDEIHTLVNNPYSLSLKGLAGALERIAVTTKKPIDVKAAKDARKMSDEHEAKQNLIDKREQS